MILIVKYGLYIFPNIYPNGPCLLIIRHGSELRILS